MQTSAHDLVGLLTSVERVAASHTLNNEQKKLVLGEMLNGLPPDQFCVYSKQTKAIVTKIIQEKLYGLQPPEKAKSEKPKQNRAGKAPTKSTKK